MVILNSFARHLYVKHGKYYKKKMLFCCCKSKLRIGLKERYGLWWVLFGERFCNVKWLSFQSPSRMWKRETLEPLFTGLGLSPLHPSSLPETRPRLITLINHSLTGQLVLEEISDLCNLGCDAPGGFVCFFLCVCPNSWNIWNALLIIYLFWLLSFRKCEEN